MRADTKSVLDHWYILSTLNNPWPTWSSHWILGWMKDWSNSNWSFFLPLFLPPFLSICVSISVSKLNFLSIYLHLYFYLQILLSVGLLHVVGKMALAPGCSRIISILRAWALFSSRVHVIIFKKTLLTSPQVFATRDQALHRDDEVSNLSLVIGLPLC